MDTGLLMIALLIIGIFLAGYGHQRSRKFSEQIFKDIQYGGWGLLTVCVLLAIGRSQGFIA
ncbi:MAG: hypothetical protein KJ947_10405 [Alphaproteobacteria bacterium]|nr:hypothetical protein [Alphaproteobacteria bacterium]MBU1549970.1 hypothetical protein [Alphaproteobacteria bacterium]MBU2336574.1 hypothetical protein [Alphaproteobacteria bacterium]MBU2387307.1 hypothetical protein [Alphaproteobacteria bacterium]